MTDLDLTAYPPDDPLRRYVFDEVPAIVAANEHLTSEVERLRANLAQARENGDWWFQVSTNTANKLGEARARVAELERQQAEAVAIVRAADEWIERVGQFTEAVIIMAKDRTPGLTLLADLALWNDRRRAFLAAPDEVLCPRCGDPRPCTPTGTCPDEPTPPAGTASGSTAGGA